MTDRLASVRTPSRSAIVAALRAARAARRGVPPRGHAQAASDAPDTVAPAVAAETVQAEAALMEASAPAATTPAAQHHHRPRRWVAKRRPAAPATRPLDMLMTGEASHADPTAEPDTTEPTAAAGTEPAAPLPYILTMKVAGSLFAGLVNAAASASPDAAEGERDSPAPEAGPASGIDEDIATATSEPVAHGPDATEAEAEFPGIAEEETALAAADQRAPAEDVDSSADAMTASPPDAQAPPHMAADEPDAPSDQAAEESPPPAEAAEAQVEISLTVIPGLGPGVSLRLARLGYRTIDDLSGADPEVVKAALGEISRLLDVDQWISHARQLAADEHHG